MSHDSPELPPGRPPYDQSLDNRFPPDPSVYDLSPQDVPPYDRSAYDPRADDPAPGDRTPYDRPSPTWSTGELELSGLRAPDPNSGAHRTLRLLRRAYRWQRRVATFTALGYFAGFLTLTVKAPSVMARPGPGGLPTGLLLALVQIPVTWLAVLLYEAAAHRFVDPLARHARRQTRGAVAEREQAP
ncbi:DUF485 domain-containing protein [Streptomyces sp. NPDC093970]|uniref:DUF485 domain-containing protein n=1 Tax=Streptomyces sp. NPDC093970 TaxID=3155076 RepID=UPI00341424A0